MQQRGRLTLRRICCAVFAVAMAFVAIMVRSLPSENETHRSNTAYVIIRDPADQLHASTAASASVIVFSLDVLLQAITKVRLPQDHVKECGSLEDRSERHSWSFPWTRDCSDGVLYVPSLSLSTIHRSDQLSWRRKCAWTQPIPSCFTSVSNNLDGTCLQQAITPLDPCFRGVHDNLITKEQVAGVVSLGKSIIRSDHDADHFDIHYETERLPPSLLQILHDLLTTAYRMPRAIEPVAFRVHTSAPRNGDTSFSTKSGTMMQHPLLRLMNRKRYLQWSKGASSNRQTPWLWSLVSGGPSPGFHGDACHLLADSQADARFQVHTSIFLTEDYSGGAILFVDDGNELHGVGGRQNSVWNKRRRRRIQRGLAVDGRLGRVVVSSGDCLRCHLPVRQGVRAVLQIWWRCGTSGGVAVD